MIGPELLLVSQYSDLIGTRLYGSSVKYFISTHPCRVTAPPSLNMCGRGSLGLVDLCHDSLGQLLPPAALDDCGVLEQPEMNTKPSTLVSSPHRLDFCGGILLAQSLCDPSGKPHPSDRLALGRSPPFHSLVVPPPTPGFAASVLALTSEGCSKKSLADASHSHANQVASNDGLDHLGQAIVEKYISHAVN